MKIGILTNLTVNCGNAQYARDMYKYLSAYDCGVWLSDKISDLYHVDVVIINYHPAVVPITTEQVRQMHDHHQKVILVLQNSVPEMNVGENDILRIVDKVVTHEPMHGNVNPVIIPHGIVEVSDLRIPSVPMVGVAGFPFTWKRFDIVASVAKQLNIKCRIIAPSSPMMNTDRYVNELERALGPLADIHRDFKPVEEVVRLLSECTFNIFWYENQTPEDAIGQSGSVLMGVAARRPMIISKHRKFRMLLKYWNSFYVAHTIPEIYEQARWLLENEEDYRRTPSYVADIFSWKNAASMYFEVARDLCFQGVF